jgi:hypothetical protein
MHRIIKFISLWIVPIGFVRLIANDKLYTLDSIGKSTYWRVSDCRKTKGAGVLIRRS